MMNELIDKVTRETGLTPEQAKAAAESAVAFLKSKLPGPLASGLESLMAGGAGGGEAGAGGIEAEATEVLGNLFRKNS